MKKLTAFISSLVMCAAALTAPVQQAIVKPMKASAGDYNYAEALQKSMFFYEVQQAGKLPDWNMVSWRADSMVKEDGTSSDIVPGGWFDAGDHFKFTLTNAYSASVLAWGYIQYKDAIDKAGLGELYRNNVQWGIDYVLGCDLGDGKMIGTIGDFTGGSTDHNIWCSAEVYMRKHKLNNDDEERPYDEITDSSTLMLSAATLAEGYIIFKDSQPEKAAEYLEHAQSLFASADATRDIKDIGAYGNMYPVSSWVDDAMYAANWLYMATGDQSYLDKCKTDYIPMFPTESQSTDKKYTWGFCWDDTTQGAALLYAINTGDKEWIDHISHHLEYWIDGYGGKQVSYTPDGLAYLMSWGPLRHAANTAWIAKLASDTIFSDDSAKATRYNDWAKSQMDYCLGDNAIGMCYVLGMGDKNPKAIHHRTASGIHDDHWNDLGSSTTSSEGWQTEYAHTLYGALIGGPNSSGEYGDDVSVSQYEYTEVAIDYNAGWTAALCAMVDDYGGEMLADFPPVETPKWAEWEVAAVLNGKGDSYTEIKAWAMNHTAWPARVAKDIEYRYYFDVSELLAAGLSIDNITVMCGSQQYQEGEQGYATVSGPHLYEGDPTGNTYYARIKFEDGRAIQPTGQSEHRDEVQFRISIPDAIDGQSTKGAWDPTNDYSYEGVENTDSLKSDEALNERITMYVDGNLVWGIEPDGTTPKPTETPVKPDPTDPVIEPTDEPTTEGETASGEEPMYGDVNEDGEVDLVDVVLLNKYLMIGANVTKQGEINADVDRNTILDEVDSLNILKSIIKLVELPL